MLVHVRTIELSKSSNKPIYSVWGTICVQIGDVFFPDEDWDDVLSSVLDMWLSAICDFIELSKQECILDFMDGPYRIVLHRKSGKVEAVFENDLHFNRCVFPEIDVSIFAKSLYVAANDMINACKENIVQFTSRNTCNNICKGMKRLKRLLDDA